MDGGLERVGSGVISPAHYTHLEKVVEQIRTTTSGELHGLLGAYSFASIFDQAGYVPEYFTPEEIFPPAVVEHFKGSESIWGLMDARILWTADALRNHFKTPIRINNWASGGTFSQRGFRTEYGTALFSQHKFGRALDMDVGRIPAQEVRAELVIHHAAGSALTRFITAIEDKVNWVHIDCRNTNSSHILIFNP